jgi:hypothetical protein
MGKIFFVCIPFHSPDRDCEHVRGPIRRPEFLDTGDRYADGPHGRFDWLARLQPTSVRKLTGRDDRTFTLSLLRLPRF